MVAIGAIVASFAYTIARRGLLSLGLALGLLVVYVLQIVSALASFGFAFALLSPVTFDLGLFLGPGWTARPWTWVTFQFIHASEAHLLLNLMGLVFFSPAFEERVGRSAWAALFFVGGAFGALAFALVRGGGGILLGASAGVVAVFGGYGRLFPRERVRLFLPLPGLPAFRVIHVVIGYVVLETVLSVVGPDEIAWVAHVGAAVFGLALAPALARLPGGRAHRAKLAGLDGLRSLATTRELESILAEAEKADLPEVRNAWIEKFVRAARCPQCGGPLRLRFGRVASDCGWRGKME